MTDPSDILRPGERDTLTAADREFLDDAWQALTPEQEAVVRSLSMLIRAIVRHDTAGIRVEVQGWPQLLDAEAERQRELIEAVRELRGVIEEFRAYALNSSADRADLRAQLEALERRVETIERVIGGVATIIGQGDYQTRADESRSEMLRLLRSLTRTPTPPAPVPADDDEDDIGNHDEMGRP